MSVRCLPRTGALVLLCASAAFAAFTSPFTPAFRGQPLTQYAYWESFSFPFNGLNPPTDPTSNAPATIEQLNPSAILTGGGNLYIFSGVPEYVLRSDAPAPIERIVVQTSTGGNELDYAATVLEYVDAAGQVQQLPPTTSLELARYPAVGVSVEMLFEWDLAPVSEPISSIVVRLYGAATNISLDAVAFDVKHGPLVGTYCTGKLNSQGCTPVLSTSGAPSAANAQPFVVTATGVIPGAASSLFYGLSGSASTPFQGGTICVAGPLRRTPVQFATNVAGCAAQVQFDFNAWAASGADSLLVAGRSVNAQVWSRDGQSFGGSGFSNAVAFTLAP